MRQKYPAVQFNSGLYNLLNSPMIWSLFPVLFLLSFEANGQAMIKLEPSRAQNAGAYGEHFTKYAIGTMDKAQVATLLQGNEHFDTLSLVANGITYTFSLDARDVRGDNYVLRTQTETGIQELPRTPNKTYSGLNWDGNYPVCITADEQFFTAMIMTNTGSVFVESAKLIDPSAGDDQFVIFHSTDMVKPVENSLCGTKIPQHFEEPKTDSTSSRSLLTCIVSEIAIANDYTMFTKYGNSVPNLETQNLAIINLVNTNYDNEFSQEVWHKVVEIFVATSSGSDPWYTGTDPALLLESFTDWAPNGFFINNDVGSLWTNRDFDGSTIGLAWLVWPCDADDYNVLQDFSPNFAFLRVLQAHELGHNYGYGHDGSGGFIMSPSVSESTVWSAPSISTLNSNFVQYSYCLGFCPLASTGRVGIGTTSPNATAILDITSTNKGLLMPRLTTLQRSNIYKPADGLVVYDTGTKSFWYYNNTAWVEIIDGKAFPSHANNVTLGSIGNVGIGVYPSNKLDIATETRLNPNLHPTNLPVYITGSGPDYKGLEVRHPTAEQGIGISPTTIYATGFTSDNYLGLEAKGPAGFLNFITDANERMRITGPGNVGIGTSFPNAPLQFASTTANRKIVLFEGVNNDHQYYGFGVNGSMLRYQVDAPSAAHVFFAAVDGTQSKELMRIMGSGPVGIGLMNPLNRLDINNGAANRTGTHATGQALYVTGDFGSASNGVQFRNNDATQGIGFGYNTIYAAGSMTSQDLNINAKGATGNIIFNTNNAEKVRITGAGRIGIGTNTPNEKLEIATDGRAFFGDGGGASRKGLLIDGVEPSGARIEAFDYSSNAGIDLLLNPLGGNVGIGTSNSNAPLQFATEVGNRKIVLYETVNNDHQFIGFGVDSTGALRYQTATSVNDHVFYAATSATASNELMRIRGTGNVKLAGIIETEAVAVPTLANGFTQFGGGFASVSYYKDKEGIVHVRGMANVPVNPVGLVIFNLPAGYRPSTSGAHVFMTIGNNVATRVDVLSNGNVIFNSGTTGWVSLDGIAFRAD